MRTIASIVTFGSAIWTFFINLITKLIYYITLKHDPYTIIHFFYCLKLTPLENYVSN